MRRPALLLTAALLAAAAQTAPGASAAGGTVRADASVIKQTVGNGVVATALCTARATPGPGEIAVVTSVRCSINGFLSPTVSAPGPFAAVVHANATTNPVTVCVYATATFSPTIGPTYTVNSSTCLTA